MIGVDERRFGSVEPGSICSSRWRARTISSRIASTLAVQTKGAGAAFHAARKSAMARCARAFAASL
jgi:hypothetical protein